jgi:hypothetical protein
VGLPRSSLVKSTSIAPQPQAVPVPPAVPAPLAFAVTAPLAFPVPELTSAFEAPRDTVASVDVELEVAEVRPPNASIVDAGPSAQVLLDRAAALGPVRPTWESFVLPSDPVLGEKMTPHVAERRARFRRVVKATLGACVGLCVVSLLAVALGGGNEAKAAPRAAATVKTTPSTAVTTVEKMDYAKREKAPHETAHRAHRASHKRH